MGMTRALELYPRLLWSETTGPNIDFAEQRWVDRVVEVKNPDSMYTEYVRGLG
jgi:hypothetical protein